jgi:peptide/nickel transport system permease protein
MIGYIVRRFLSGLVLVFALTWITFALFWLVPAQPWRALLPSYLYPNPTLAQIQAANHKLGVDRPVIVQYGKYVWHLARYGDFGKSYYGSDVTTLLKTTLPVTGSIVLGGAVLLFLLAVPLGTLSALRENTWVDRAILTVSILGVALHPFIIGIGLQGLFSSKLHWLPKGFYCPLHAPPQASPLAPQPCGGPADWAAHLALPWIVFAVIFLPLYLRIIRAQVITVLDEQYVTAARAKGASTVRVMRSHVLRNALLQPITMVGMEIGLAITVSIYLETIFSLGGVGRLAIGAVGGTGDHFDLPILAGVVFTIALAIIVLNLIVDLVYAALDPRARVIGTPTVQPAY